MLTFLYFNIITAATLVELKSLRSNDSFEFRSNLEENRTASFQRIHFTTYNSTNKNNTFKITMIKWLRNFNFEKR
jgi:hypothetical protein